VRLTKKISAQEMSFRNSLAVGMASIVSPV
jgi:hypothetical protein